MRKGLLAALGAMLLSPMALQAQAQSQSCPLPVEQPVLDNVVWDCAPAAPRFWASAEYLLWWIRNDPAAIPLFTTGDVADPVPGALGQPGTRVLFGDSLDYGTFSGLRVSAGVNLTDCVGLEGSYFLLEQRSVQFNFASDAAGAPLFGRPFFDTFNNLQNNFNTANSNPGTGVFAGQSSLSSQTRLWGFDVNLTANLVDDGCVRFDVLAGYRQLDLDEDLLFTATIFPPGTGNIDFGGVPASPTSTIADFDLFGTRNRFYGGQIGARADWLRGRATIGMVGKIAFGCTQERVTIDGASFMSTAGGTAALPGGLFAQVSNIGTQRRSEFAVVPEGQVNVGWQFSPCVRATFGYTFMYWSRVARPARSSDFWAQGLTFGVLFTY